VVRINRVCVQSVVRINRVCVQCGARYCVEVPPCWPVRVLCFYCTYPSQRREWYADEHGWSDNEPHTGTGEEVPDGD